MHSESMESTGEEIDLSVLLSDFLRIARRWWLLALVLMMVLTGAFSLRAYRNYVPMYRASATFTVYVTDPLQAEIRGYNVATAEQMAKTFPYILTSSALQDMVRRDLELPYLPAISASVLHDTNIFTMTVTSRDPEEAYAVLNAVIARYPDVAEFVVGPTIMNLLDESGVPAEPYNSHSWRGAVKKGVLLGAGIWLCLMVLLTVVRSTVHNEDELQRLLNIRCMGLIPVVRGSRRAGGSCPIMSEETGNAFSEAIRLLRVRVEKAMHEQHRQVLLVSSATPGEGKTTVAVNLALSLAGKGSRTLLVDCDLRNPSVARNLQLENQNGLTDVLQGRLNAEDCIRTTNCENLFVMTAGAPADNAAELLAGNNVRSLLEQARAEFDCILLDTPPSSLLADASELAEAADGALLVIRQNYGSRRSIAEGAQLLTGSGVPLIGCALNYITGRSFRSYSGYYGYGYGSYSHYHRTAEVQEED